MGVTGRRDSRTVVGFWKSCSGLEELGENGGSRIQYMRTIGH